MPGPEQILIGLTALANDFKWLAVVWHVLFGAAIGWISAAGGPSSRLLVRLITASVVSLAVLAWVAGNPFNGIVFATLAMLLTGGAVRFGASTTSVPLWQDLAGSCLLLFAWVYPHFLVDAPWHVYLYAAPLGVLPCPTLTAAIGLTLRYGLVSNYQLSVPVSMIGILYGLLGVFWLGVTLDVVLLAAAVILTGRIVWLSRKSGTEILQVPNTVKSV